MEEQGFEDEFDEIDSRAKHVVIYVDDKAVATGRTFSDNEPEIYIIGRVAIDKQYRKQHLGSRVVEALENKVKEMGGKKIELSAQYNARHFYEKLGYQCVGEIYLDEHCEHIKMEKSII